MIEYPHIDSIFKRDERGDFIEGHYSQPAFEYLANNEWVGSEKVDGTNIRIMWDGESFTIGGKTDTAQILPFLTTKLLTMFSNERLALVFTEPACLYGEGYGARIQKGGGNYIKDGVSLVLFDVLVGKWWLKQGAVAEIAGALGLRVVPNVFFGTLDQAIDATRNGFISAWGDFTAEGLVLKPTIDLLQRNGERVITKIKHRDFRPTNKGRR